MRQAVTPPILPQIEFFCVSEAITSTKRIAKFAPKLRQNLKSVSNRRHEFHILGAAVY